MEFEIYKLIGLLGVGFYLGTYAVLQVGLLSARSYLYSALNVFASGFLLLSMLAEFSLSSTIVNATWLLLSIYGLVRVWMLNHAPNYTTLEQGFVDARLHGVSPPSIRRFLNAGEWSNRKPGEVIAEQGTVIGKLYYLAAGSAEIQYDGLSVTTVPAGVFIGEISLFSGKPANATVVVDEHSIFFEIDRDAVLKLVRRDADFRGELENAMARDTAEKLSDANARLAERGSPSVAEAAE